MFSGERDTAGLYIVCHAHTPPLESLFSPQSIPQHTRFSTGQFHASENARLGESRKLERWLWK